MKKDYIPTTTWFLLPQWNIAIQLTNGTWISWNGKKCAHCSSIPSEHDGFRILSLFTSPENGLCKHFMDKESG